MARKLKKIFSKKSEKFFFEQPEKIRLAFSLYVRAHDPPPPQGRGVHYTKRDAGTVMRQSA